MTKNNQRSIKTIRQKFRKYVRDHEEFSDLMTKYRESPDDDEADNKTDEEDSDSESEEEVTFLKKGDPFPDPKITTFAKSEVGLTLLTV